MRQMLESLQHRVDWLKRWQTQRSEVQSPALIYEKEPNPEIFAPVPDVAALQRITLKTQLSLLNPLKYENSITIKSLLHRNNAKRRI